MENGNESAKVKNEAPSIPGNLAYTVIKKKIPKKSRYDDVYIDTAFADFLWCIKARSKDIAYPNITGILIEPTKIIATDGHRLHIITNPYPSIPLGEYEVYGINQSKVILIAIPHSTNSTKFPKWDRPTITMEGNKPEHEITINHHHPAYFYYEILKRRICNIKYLEDAISNEPMNVRIYGENQPVIITTLTRTAIIMPLLDRRVSW
jgi:hypothetical protein